MLTRCYAPPYHVNELDTLPFPSAKPRGPLPPPALLMAGASGGQRGQERNRFLSLLTKETGVPVRGAHAALISRHASKAVSIRETSAGCMRPKYFRARGAATVAGLCTRNAPGSRNGKHTATSKREPRSVVVCGMNVMRSRSVSPQAPLSTSTGRIFSAMPRSTSQISPLLGFGFIGIKGSQDDPGGFVDVLVGKWFPVKHRLIEVSAQGLGDGMPIFRRQAPHQFDDVKRDRPHDGVFSSKLCEAQGGLDVRAGQRGKAGENVVPRFTGRELIEDDCDWNASALDDRAAATDPGVDFDSFLHELTFSHSGWGFKPLLPTVNSPNWRLSC